jgi:NADH-quinone oxidoreductase subunit N
MLICLSFTFILSGFFFKFSIVPFHNWTPDVYEGSPYLITAFFALVPKIAIFSVLFNLFVLFISNFHNIFFNILLFCSVLSILVGSLAALYQTNLKRLLAYSTISNMGFILLGLSLNTFEGYHASLMYLIIYVLLMTCLFGTLLQTRSALNNKLFLNISELSSLFRSFPILTIIISLILFSLAGIPPLAGFFSKFYLVFALLKSKMLFTSFFIVFVGVYSCIYYIRLIKVMYFEKPFIWTLFHSIKSELNFYLLIFITFFNICFYYFLDFLLDLTRNVLLRIFI